MDSKNWTPTPEEVQRQLARTVVDLAPNVDAIILLDQVDLAETGVVTRALLEQVRALSITRPDLLILADSRRGLRDFPPVGFKMNGAELATLTGQSGRLDLPQVKRWAAELAERNGRQVFVTLSESGMVGAEPGRPVVHVPSLPLRGEIDIVGAGDAVTANLTAALSAGAALEEALTVANAAASIVIHQLGTTGTASVGQLREFVA